MAADANQRCTENAKSLLDEILQRVLCRGFYGTATIELTVDDGVIQQMRDVLERKRRVTRK